MWLDLNMYKLKKQKEHILRRSTLHFGASRLTYLGIGADLPRGTSNTHLLGYCLVRLL